MTQYIPPLRVILFATLVLGICHRRVYSIRSYMIKVLIADDQEVVRQGLATLLAYHENLEIVGQASNGTETCLLARELKPHVILMDIRMPECDGITATETILRENPTIKVLILTTFDDDELIIKALKAGASGYLLKDTKSDRSA